MAQQIETLHRRPLEELSHPSSKVKSSGCALLEQRVEIPHAKVRERAIKGQQASWTEDDVKPLRPLYNFI